MAKITLTALAVILLPVFAHAVDRPMPRDPEQRTYGYDYNEGRYYKDHQPTHPLVNMNRAAASRFKERYDYYRRKGFSVTAARAAAQTHITRGSSGGWAGGRGVSIGDREDR